MAALASEQAFDVANGELLKAAATLDEVALTAIAEELAAVAAAFRAEPQLRRILTDVTVEGEAKANLIAHLFKGKIAASAYALVVVVSNQRWASGRDLVDGLRRLSRTALFLKAERSREIDEVEEQLFRFGRVLDASPELGLALDDPAATAHARAGLIGGLLRGKAHPLTVELLTDLASDLGGRSFAHGVAELVEQAAQRRDKIVAIATSAITLSDAESERLRSALSRIYGREVAVHVIVDPALAGGLRVQIGDEVIDGSINGRLQSLRARLAR